MTTTRRNFFRAIGGAAGGALVAWSRSRAPRGGRGASPSLAAWSRSRPGGGGGWWRIDEDILLDAWLLWRGHGASFYLRITRPRPRGRQQLWEIFADAECTERLAGVIFTAPGLPRLVAVHHGVTLTLSKSAAGWLEAQVT